MIHGDITKINLGTASFERIITHNSFFIDKSKFIEHVIRDSNTVILITRPRRSGKSLNLDMLRCFLTDKSDNRNLFKGLYIENSCVWEKINSALVFSFSFKNMNAANYRSKLFLQVYTEFYNHFDDSQLSKANRFKWDMYCDQRGADSDGLLLLSELAYYITGKRPYILIDEYDKVLRDYYNADEYDVIFEHIKQFLSAGMKDNSFLEKAVLTGVLRISYESMFSDLNNIKTYDMYGDQVYTDDYGITDEEMDEIQAFVPLDRKKIHQWYNGIKINQKPIYNIYSVSAFLDSRRYECYWGSSKLLEMTIELMNENRRQVILEFLNGEQNEVPVDTRVSLKQLWEKRDDSSFYSFLIQGGYLALDKLVPEKYSAMASIPNIELSDVWKRFILTYFYPEHRKIMTMFDNADNLSLLSKDIERFINDSLSYFDLSVHKGEEAGKIWERVYHIFVLGILAAYSDTKYIKPVSEGEGGDGRYDILYQRGNAYFIFEFKSCNEVKQLKMHAHEALNQITTKRYAARLDPDRPIIKVGIAVYGKQCKVICGR